MATSWDSYKCRWRCLVLLFVTAVSVNAGPHPLRAPQLRQRQNLAHGICNRPLAISVCLESCMAENAGEFAHMGLFASNLIKYFTHVQPNTIKMAINYCSSIQQWVDWTPSTEVFANYVMGMNQLYTFNINNAFGAYGPFGVYGAYSPLQPAAGVCLEKARLAMAQLPPSYQPLVILFTSGRSSNPMYTIQQAQAVMLGGAELFAVTEKEPEMSEELRLSVSGPSYLLAVNDMRFLGRPEIDAVIMNVCKIERSANSPVFPINLVGDLQRPNNHFNLPPLLAQRSDQMTATTISSLNATTADRNITSPDLAFSVVNTTGFGNSSTESLSSNSSLSEARDNKLLHQQLNTSESVSIWQNVTEIPTALSTNNSSLHTLPTEAIAKESLPFGVTKAGISKTIAPVTVQSASFSTLEFETTLSTSSETNSTFENKTTFQSLISENTTIGPLGSGRNSTGTLASDNSTFGLLPLAVDSEDTLLVETTQSVLLSSRSNRSDAFDKTNRSAQMSSGVSEINGNFSNISGTPTVLLETRSTHNPLSSSSSSSSSSQTSTTDDSRFEAQHFVTLPSQTSLPISSAVTTEPNLFRSEVLPSNNFQTRNILGDVMLRNNAFTGDRLLMNIREVENSGNQNQAASEPPQEFMRDECLELEGITDPGMRSKMLQERPDCKDNTTIPQNTLEMPCVSLRNETHPLVQLNILLVNISRQPCADNTPTIPLTSTASQEISPEINTSSPVPERSRGVSPEARICIDLNNVLDIYRLAVILVNWPDQSAGENNIATPSKQAHVESISELGGILSGKGLKIDHLALFDRLEQFQQIAETTEALSTPEPCISKSVRDNPVIRKALQSAHSLRQPCVESDNTTSIINSTSIETLRRISRELDSNNLNNNPATISSLLDSTDTTTMTRTETAIFETVSITKINLAATNQSCIDISSAPNNTRSIIIELIKPFKPCPIQKDAAEIPFTSFPETTLSSTSQSESNHSCADLATLPPFIQLIVKIFPVLNPCEKLTRVKLTKRAASLDTSNNTSSVSISLGDVSSPSKISIDHQLANITCENPCVDISILPESDRQLAIDFFRLYNILTCNGQKSVHSASDQLEKSGTCVNATMFSEKERTTITIYFSIYGIPPCSGTHNCLEFTLLPQELLSKYPELYGPVDLCNTEAPTVSAHNSGEKSTIPPSLATTNELCRDASVVGDLGLTASSSNCYSFVICYGRTPDGNWTKHDLVPCPPQLFWSQEKLLCVPPEESSCITELCINENVNLKMASMVFPECSEYLQCNSGRITRNCCPEGQIFHDGGCQTGINIGCPNSCQNTHTVVDVVVHDPR